MTTVTRSELLALLIAAAQLLVEGAWPIVNTVNIRPVGTSANDTAVSGGYAKGSSNGDQV